MSINIYRFNISSISNYGSKLPHVREKSVFYSHFQVLLQQNVRENLIKLVLAILVIHITFNLKSIDKNTSSIQIIEKKCFCEVKKVEIGHKNNKKNLTLKRVQINNFFLNFFLFESNVQ